MHRYILALLCILFLSQGSAAGGRTEISVPARQGIPLGEHLKYSITWLGIPVGYGELTVMMPSAVFADSVTKTTTTTTVTTIHPDAPIYTGTIEENAVLEPLTLEEFQNFGTKPAAAFQQYQEYIGKVKNPTADTGALPYRMKIYRPLTVVDFEGNDVTKEVAQVRYDTYVKAVPVVEDGREIRYVYVYREPGLVKVKA